LPSSGDLLDANVWLALAAESHAHHQRAAAYWRNEAAPVAVFCRVMQLAFLRHLTNKTIMGNQVLTMASAWDKLGDFMALPEVQFRAEPFGLEEQFGALCRPGRINSSFWTDAYLAAFATCAGLRLVTFDRGFAGFMGLNVLILH